MSSPGDTPARHRYRPIAWAVRRRCPRCGARGVWSSFLRMRPHCPSCGLELDRGESDYFYGAYLLNFVAAELVAILAFVVGLVITLPSPPWNFLMGITVALAVIAPILLYPTTKALWLAVDLIFRPERS
ncbi:MAG TPA: DUF983 domain-containing protein [Gemmatimonadaceae bacterium]